MNPGMFGMPGKGDTLECIIGSARDRIELPVNLKAGETIGFLATVQEVGGGAANYVRLYFNSDGVSANYGTQSMTVSGAAVAGGAIADTRLMTLEATGYAQFSGYISNIKNRIIWQSTGLRINYGVLASADSHFGYWPASALAAQPQVPVVSRMDLVTVPGQLMGPGSKITLWNVSGNPLNLPQQ